MSPNFWKTSDIFSTTFSLHFHTVVSLSTKVPYFSLHVIRIGWAQSFLQNKDDLRCCPVNTCSVEGGQAHWACSLSCSHLTQAVFEKVSLIRRPGVTYATPGKVVVKSKNMFAVVEALDVVTRGRVVGTPGNMIFNWLLKHDLLHHMSIHHSPIHVVHYV